MGAKVLLHHLFHGLLKGRVGRCCVRFRVAQNGEQPEDSGQHQSEKVRADIQFSTSHISLLLCVNVVNVFLWFLGTVPAPSEQRLPRLFIQLEATPFQGHPPERPHGVYIWG